MTLKMPPFFQNNKALKGKLTNFKGHYVAFVTDILYVNIYQRTVQLICISHVVNYVSVTVEHVHRFRCTQYSIKDLFLYLKCRYITHPRNKERAAVVVSAQV